MFEAIKNFIKGVGILALAGFAAMILAVVAYIVWIVIQIAATVGFALAIYMVSLALVAMILFIAAGCCHE